MYRKLRMLYIPRNLFFINCTPLNFNELHANRENLVLNVEISTAYSL